MVGIQEGEAARKVVQDECRSVTCQVHIFGIAAEPAKESNSPWTGAQILTRNAFNTSEKRAAAAAAAAASILAQQLGRILPRMLGRLIATFCFKNGSQPGRLYAQSGVERRQVDHLVEWRWSVANTHARTRKDPLAKRILPLLTLSCVGVRHLLDIFPLALNLRLCCQQTSTLFSRPRTIPARTTNHALSTRLALPTR